MNKLFLLICISLFLLSGCKEKPDNQPPPVRISPGSPKHFDVGSKALRNKLPEDMADGYMGFAEAPGFSYGLIMAHDKISPRSHERSDLLVYVHSGFARFHVGEKDYHISMGDAVYIPRGAFYSVESSQDYPLQFFSIYSPPLDPNDIVYAEEKEK